VQINSNAWECHDMVEIAHYKQLNLVLT